MSPREIPSAMDPGRSRHSAACPARASAVLAIALTPWLYTAPPAMGQLPPPAAPPKIEPGLEQAVQWKWRVVPPDDDHWGLQVAEPSPIPASPGAPAPSGTSFTSTTITIQAPRPVQYEVQKGDALILIGRKFGMTAEQLKLFNNLESDTIRIGQVLKIPTLEELKTIQPPPPPPKAQPVEDPESEVPGKPKAAAKQQPKVTNQVQEDLLFQVFLDREGFATGPIDGKAGPMFSAVMQLYRDNHEDAQNIDQFRAKAQQTVSEALTHYTLREEDLRFIAVPEAQSGRKTSSKASNAPAPTFEELAAAPSLVYRSAWEFVAERFHCDEPFLHDLNGRIRGEPKVGAQFLVPNVIPFEVEHTVEGTLQPPADPEHPVTVAFVELTLLQVSRDGKVIAVMPTGLARPDLRGRGTWTVLDAIPRPRLATLREMKDAAPAPDATGAPAAVLASEQFLASGPNNPVGIIWINLAKAKSTEPLPYGLHGTSIPSRIKTQEGIGGIRLANWDIARAVKLIPPGTPFQWR